MDKLQSTSRHTMDQGTTEVLGVCREFVKLVVEMTVGERHYRLNLMPPH